MANYIKIFLGFFNDNLGVVTLIAGAFALFLYKRQQRDYKKDAASLILQEIRYAEQQIRTARQNGDSYSLASKLLPTNSWNDKIHLFVKDLEENQIDMINTFYAKAKYIDILILKRSDQLTGPHTQQNQFSPASIPVPQNPGQLNQFVQVTLPIPPSPESVTIGLLKQVSSSVEFIYNTPVVEKLRKISNKKWWHLF
ncbi:MAG: hypothetical protein AAB355_01380 [Patescibacteria group bacterium]